MGVKEAIGTDKTFSSKYGGNGCPDKSASGMFTYAKSKGCAWGTIDSVCAMNLPVFIPVCTPLNTGESICVLKETRNTIR